MEGSRFSHRVVTGPEVARILSAILGRTTPADLRRLVAAEAASTHAGLNGTTATQVAATSECNRAAFAAIENMTPHDLANVKVIIHEATGDK
jgi:hypothetical protein